MQVQKLTLSDARNPSKVRSMVLPATAEAMERVVRRFAADRGISELAVIRRFSTVTA